MIDISVSVERRDGTREEFPVYPPTIIAFERWAKMGISAAFTSNSVKFEHLYYLAWLAEKDSGAVVKIFDEWLKTIKKVDIVEAPKG
jgi:hypothetical protein